MLQMRIGILRNTHFEISNKIVCVQQWKKHSDFLLKWYNDTPLQVKVYLFITEVCLKQ